MAVSSTQNTVSYSGNGSTTAFSVPFPFQQNSDLVVTLINNSNSVETLQTIGTHYSVTGAGGSSGTVTMGAAPSSGYTLRIDRTVTLTQGTSFRTQGSFSPVLHENAFDKLTMAVQQVDRVLDDAVLDITAEATARAAADASLLTTIGNEIATLRADVIDDSGGVLDARTVQATGGVLQRTLATHFSDWVNVANYGTDGTALASAASYASSSGKGILIPSTVDISSVVGTISSPILFVGTGKLNLQAGGSVTLTGALQAPLRQIFQMNSGSLTFQSKVSGVFPQWWGAVADGTTDDSVALQNSMDAAFSASTFVWLTGRFVGSGLNLRTNLIGPGYLKLKAASSLPLIYIGANNLLIANLEIDGNKANQTTGIAGGVSGYATVALITNITTPMDPPDIVYDQIDGVTIKNCYFHDSWETVIYFWGCSRISILENQFDNNQNCVILINANTEFPLVNADCDIVGNRFYNNGLAYPTSSNGEVGGDPILIGKVKNVRVRNNSSDRNGRAWLYTGAIEEIEVSGNKVTNCMVNAAEFFPDDLGVNARFRKALFSDNYFSTYGDGMAFTGGANRNFVYDGILITNNIVQRGIPTRWATGQTIAISDMRSSKKGLYVAKTAGTTGATAPTGVTSSFNDGGVTWAYVESCNITGWTASTVYAPDEYVITGTPGRFYICWYGGTSASSGTGPSGTGTTIVDGTVKWRFIGDIEASIGIWLQSQKWRNVKVFGNQIDGYYDGVQVYTDGANNRAAEVDISYNDISNSKRHGVQITVDGTVFTDPTARAYVSVVKNKITNSSDTGIHHDGVDCTKNLYIQDNVITGSGNNDIKIDAGCAPVEALISGNVGTSKMVCDLINYRHYNNSSSGTQSVKMLGTKKFGEFDFGGSLAQKTLTIASGVLAIDLNVARVFYVVLDQNITSITLTGGSPSGYSFHTDEFKIAFTQDNAGSRTIAGWPSAIKLAGGAFTMTSTANKTDTLTFTRSNYNSSNYYESGRVQNT